MTVSLATLNRIASTYAAGVLPLGSRQSLPVPCRHEDRLLLAFMYCRAEFQEPGEGVCLWPPSYVAYVASEGAQFERLVAVTPADFTCDDSPDEPLGLCRTQDELTSDVYLTNLARLYQAGDVLLPQFMTGLPPKTPHVVEQVSEYISCFTELREPALAPYYESLGNEFLSWIRASA